MVYLLLFSVSVDSIITICCINFCQVFWFGSVISTAALLWQCKDRQDTTLAQGINESANFRFLQRLSVIFGFRRDCPRSLASC